jgi:hypothetical protein
LKTLDSGFRRNDDLPGFRRNSKLSYYLCVQGGALSHCEAWTKSHDPSISASLSSQRISEILASIGTDGKQTFLVKWMNRVLEDDYICYDITSVS